MLPGREKFKEKILADKTAPLFEFARMNYDEYLSSEREISSAAMRVLIMTEMTDTPKMNAVYSKAKLESMRVMIALPAQTDHWCAMVDASGGPAMIEDDYQLITDEVLKNMKGNRCNTTANWLAMWTIRTMYSMFGCMINPSLESLYTKHGLIKVHWCFSGIPHKTGGLLDDCLAIAIDRNWVCIAIHVFSSLFTMLCVCFLYTFIDDPKLFGRWHD